MEQTKNCLNHEVNHDDIFASKHLIEKLELTVKILIEYATIIKTLHSIKLIYYK
jgi:hypothetical protein